MKTVLTEMIYIASPYSYKQDGASQLFIDFVQNERFKTVTKTIARLQDAFPYAFIGPITQGHSTVRYMSDAGARAFEFWERRDLTYISHCDELWVVTMPGWRESKGLAKEVDFARGLGLLIKYVDPDTLEIVETNNEAR